MTITAIPMEYNGIVFRSTLEASWARTLDTWDWHWSYEPIALDIDGVKYLPDFWVPNQNLWLEVKGPHNERLDKAERLEREFRTDDLDIHKPLIVILRPADRRDNAVWEGALPGSEIVLSRCPECQHQTFVDLEGVWVCRMCWTGQRLSDKPRRWVTDYRTSGDVAFWRAPRTK